jgi:hypothetical protein
MQALYALALKPIAETRGDPNSYGFRDGRSCHDAIQQVFIALAKSYSAEWILEGDIKSCFDGISHAWLLENIPMDKKILKAWLQAGYVEEGKLFPTTEGTPQGGIRAPPTQKITSNLCERFRSKSMPDGAIRNKMSLIFDIYGIIFMSYDQVLHGATKPADQFGHFALAKAFVKRGRCVGFAATLRHFATTSLSLRPGSRECKGAIADSGAEGRFHGQASTGLGPKVERICPSDGALRERHHCPGLGTCSQSWRQAWLRKTRLEKLKSNTATIVLQLRKSLKSITVCF